MTRREAFQAILQHRTPDRVILDLGGCPLSILTDEAAQWFREDEPSGSTFFPQFWQINPLSFFANLLLSMKKLLVCIAAILGKMIATT